MSSESAMKHQHMLNAPQIPETDDDRGWNQPDQSYKHMARVGAVESSSLVHSMENIAFQGGPIPSWAPRSSGYSSSTRNGELTHYQPNNTGQSRGLFPDQPIDRNFYAVPNNNLHHPSSSSLSGKTVLRVDEAFRNQTTGMRSHKRKIPCLPQLSTSRYYDVGSSSNMHLPADAWHGKQNTELYHTHQKYQTDYSVDSLSSNVESTPRNVRSRSGVYLEHNSAKAHLSSNMLHQTFNSPSPDQSNLLRQSSSIPTVKLNRLMPAGHGVTIDSGPSLFNQDPNTLSALNHHSNGSVVSGNYSNNATTDRNTGPQNANCNVNQSTRGIQYGYDQRAAPTFKASSSNFHAGQVSASNEGLQMTAESYSSRYRQAVSNIRLLHAARNGRAGISSDRFISSIEQFKGSDVLTEALGKLETGRILRGVCLFYIITYPYSALAYAAIFQGLTTVDRSALNGSRNRFDWHRNMRLDVDNMSYEELLVLGERIGIVSTGLSENLISKCLTEAILCASDQFEDDGRCVICLEEYKHMDDVGNLKCDHDFHVGCIKKWLSMKNWCPICKAPVVDESNKGR
ncbi:hypothetical protein OROMI_002029 [Orobanche minor]